MPKFHCPTPQIAIVLASAFSLSACNASKDFKQEQARAPIEQYVASKTKYTMIVGSGGPSNRNELCGRGLAKAGYVVTVQQGAGLEYYKSSGKLKRRLRPESPSFDTDATDITP